MVDRANSDLGDVHGAVGHQHRQRCITSYCWWPRHQPGRSNLGVNELLGGERGCSTTQRLVEPGLRAQELLHDLRRLIYLQLFFVWHSAESRTLDFLPGATRYRWRGAGSV